MSATRRSFLHRFAVTTGGLAVPGLSAAATRAEIPGSPEHRSILAEGIDPAGIHAFLDAAAAQKLELHSFILMRHGRIAAEGWWAPYRKDLRHTLYSLSKSFTSTAIGLLAGEGKLSVEDKVISFFPGLLPEKVSDHLAAVRVKDLLTMSVGHATDPTFEMIKGGNWLKAFLAWPVEHAPGSHFVYNSGATYTLSAIVQKLSGKSVLDFLQPRLFAPLGIEGAIWETCPLGICTGGWGLSVPTSALAKFAQLYLQKGTWNGHQVIPAAWIAEASSKQVQQPLPEKPARANESNDWLQGYGYQFWRCRHGAFRGDGAFGQLAIIMPEQDAVLAVTAELGNMQGELDTVWEHLIPAMKAAPLPPDPAAEEKLRLRLAGLALPVPAGIAPPAPAAGRKSYHLDKNPLGLTGVEFTFTPDNCTLRFMEGSQEHRIDCGIGRWKSGQTALPGGPPRLVSGGAPKPGTAHAAAAAGAWRDERTFAIQLRFTETPHHDNLTCVFTEDSVEVSFLSSIAAMSPKPSDPRAPLRGEGHLTALDFSHELMLAGRVRLRIRGTRLSMTITLFIPCFIDALYPKAGVSMVQILERLGHTVEFPDELTCCGQPPFNSGYWDEARRVARPVLRRLENVDAVVIGSGSCGAMIKVFYPELFAGEPEEAAARSVAAKCWEFSDFLVTRLGVTDLGARFERRATFHDGCHGLRELKIKSQPRELLKYVRGLDLVEMTDAETCCGFGGTFAAKFPGISTAMGEVKCASAAQTGAEVIISNDSSCLMHLQGLLDRQGRPVKTMHLAEVLVQTKPAPLSNKRLMSDSTPTAQFQQDTARLSADLVHRQRIQSAMGKYYAARGPRQAAFRDWEEARQTAAETKWAALNELDRHLAEFEKQATARGTQVHWCSTGEQARSVIVEIIRRHKAQRIVKSKVMTSEEIHLNQLLESLGFSVVESDLGEYIQQLKGEAPYHFVFPCMHLSREEISDLFQNKLGTAPTHDPEELTMIARRVLRQKYIEADVGITGANFIVAETGMLSITENEGNARLTGALPRVMISLVGIEKVIPRMADLALFLPMLATAGTGQPITCYNTLYGGPKQPGETDGPVEWHVVLLDNNRTALLADPEQRDALHCIRCGACLNVCPVFKNIGGISYGTTYQGPIGSVITPHLRGLQDWKHLSGASSLCGACTQTCPVKIDLHHHLLQNRRNAVREKPGRLEGAAWRAFAFLMNRPRLYRTALKLARLTYPLHSMVNGTALDPARNWTKSRDLPPPAEQSFRDWWRQRSNLKPPTSP